MISVVGIGWNFSFVAATGLYSRLIRPEEQPTAQRFNEIIVLGTLSVFLVTSSYMVDSFGFDYFVLFHVLLAAVGLGIAIIGGLVGFDIEAVQSVAAGAMDKPDTKLGRQSSVV